MSGRLLVFVQLGAIIACTPLARSTPPAPASTSGSMRASGDSAATAGATRSAGAAGDVVQRAREAAAQRLADSLRVRAEAAHSVVALPSSEDIAQERARVFGDSSTAPVIDAPLGPGGVEPSWDIDVRTFATNDRVMHFVQLFTGDAKERMARRLSRGTRYDAMIRHKLSAGGIPEDMTYLALVESGYDPDAYSKAAAVGMWQFMSSTARGLRLRVDWWVDERRDPVRSTDAAVRFINFLRKQFGSMYLAAAAYNGGPGRVARGLSRYANDFDPMSGDSMFFALAETDALRRETRDYVPQIVAGALIAKDPMRYGFTIDTQPAFTYDTLTIGAATPLAAIASAAGVSVDEIRELNPQLLRGMTPPDAAYLVRLPPGRGIGLLERLAALPEHVRKAMIRVDVKKGQSMAGLARSHELTVQQLRWFNRSVARRKNGALVPGQTILVPSAATAAAARDVPDPAIERYPKPSRGRSRITTHIVKQGETLDLIAKKFGTSTKVLMQRNRLRGTMLVPGQSLLIRGASSGNRTSRASTTPASSGGGKRQNAAPGKKAASTAKGTRRR